MDSPSHTEPFQTCPHPDCVDERLKLLDVRLAHLQETGVKMDVLTITPAITQLTVELEQCRVRLLRIDQQVADLEREAEEAERLRGKLASILTRTANTLHGGELPDGWWSWHDLPELVERLRAGDDPAKDVRP